VLVTKPEDVAVEKEVVTKAHADVGVNLSKLKKLAELPGVTDEAHRMIGEIDKIEQVYPRLLSPQFLQATSKPRVRKIGRAFDF
jgi:methyl-accepting chemotaxis protein-1 (serine sensor receptor)